MDEVKLLLRDLRQAKELSQDELARQLGVSRQSIISLEQGEYLPSTRLLLDMINFFNCSVADLFSGVELNNLEEGGESQMQIMRYDPFQAIDKMHEDITDMVEKSFGRVDWPRALGASIGAMNIHETDKTYEIEVQVPGFKEDEINVELSEDSLTISGSKKEEQKEKEGRNTVRREWEQSQFSRSIRFAQPIDEKKVEAKLEDGALIIVAPKVEPTKPKTTKITVKKK